MAFCPIQNSKKFSILGMSKKRVQILVKAHIAKFLAPELNVNGEIELAKCISFLKTNNGHSHYSYFERKDGKVPLNVLMHRPSVRNMYALVRKWENDFKLRMHIMVEAYRSTGLPCMEAIRLFLAQYNISEEEYSIETAYKSWQRYKKEKDLNVRTIAVKKVKALAA